MAQIQAWLDQAADVVHRYLAFAPGWAVDVLIVCGVELLALLLYGTVIRLAIRLARRLNAFVGTTLRRSRTPLGMLWLCAVTGAVLPVASLPGPVWDAAYHVLLIASIVAVGWAAVNAMQLGAEIYLGRYRLDVEDNLTARKHVTQMRILLRAAETLGVVLTISAALMTFSTVRQYGISLFASAGAAGLILGLSARPVLGNIIAGIQIAITQPIRVDDAVLVEGEYGWIETIGSTYVVVRIWDLRRLIIPLSYFIEKPFQNWTYESSALLGAVLLEVDYSVPVQALREQLEQIVRQTSLWDGKVCGLQVTDALSQTVQLRALVSARNASAAWDLRCEVREKLIGFLQEHYPQALPRQRTELVGGSDAPGPAWRTPDRPDRDQQWAGRPAAAHVAQPPRPASQDAGAALAKSA